MSDAIPLELRDELAAPNVRRAIDPRSLPVRFSRLRLIAKSPRHYFAACQDERIYSPAMRKGRGFHAVVLGTPVAVWGETTETGRARPRIGKDWEAFRAANAGAEILSAKEYAEATALAESVRRHPRAADLIYSSGTRLEHEIHWRHSSRACVSHLDVYKPGHYVADLKCIRDASLERFGREAIWSAYHAQLAFYVAAAAANGQPVKAAYLIAVENTPPYDVTVRPLTDAALDAGERLWREWMWRLAQCEESGQWPGYAERDVPIDVFDLAGSVNLTFGDEEIAL